MDINIEKGKLQVYVDGDDIFIRKYQHSDVEPVELMLTIDELKDLIPMLQYSRWDMR